MKKQFDRKGFTLAEVLIVVAIIVVLAGVGFIALFAHMRAMHQVEMDGHAKEIFVAAQNHLTLADSQGYLGKTGGAFGTLSTADVDKPEEGENTDIFYFLVGSTGGADPNNKDSILNQMLPFGSVDESARTGGSYIIRYQKSSATVLDVFYVSTSGRYSLDEAEESNKELKYNEAMDLAGEDNKKARREEYKGGKTVLGWYGGAEAAALLKGEPLVAPGLQVLNGDKLEVIVTDNNVGAGAGQDGYKLNLIITGTSAQKVIDLSGEESTYTVTLDDVTSATGHFFNLGADFTPGENIKVKAVAFNNKLITNIAESSEVTTNSLFADVQGTVAKIGYLRHLINLDIAISRLGVSITKAEQTADLSWTDFKTNVKQEMPQIFANSATSEAGYFLPVDISSLTYDGKSFKISDIAVNYNSVAGLFGTVSNCTVQDLELVDFVIETSGSAAGALAGSVTGTSTISGILVHNSELGGGDSGKHIEVTEGSGAAGGLIGKLTGGKVESSAAAVYVSAASGSAGGLIGETENGPVVVRSYSGGHTENAKYVDAKAKAVAALNGKTYKTDINVVSTSGHAGGLIGHASGGSVNACYSTCSVASPDAAAETVGVGGLIGNAANVSINSCYSVGLVDPTGSGAKVHAFVAVSSGTTSASADCAFLSGVSESSATVTVLSNVSGETPSTNDSIFKLTGSAGASAAYDRLLTLTFQGEYPFPTVDMLAGLLTGGVEAGSAKTGITDIHYGDWQMPALNPLNFMLLNNDTLDMVIELQEDTTEITLAVQGMSSGIARIFNLTLEHTKDKADWKITGVQESAGIKDTNGNVLEYKNASPVLTDFNISATSSRLTSYDASFNVKGKRTATMNDGTEATVYDVKLTLDDVTQKGFHFAQLFANDNGTTNRFTGVTQHMNLQPGENIEVFVSAGSVAWSELSTIKYMSDLDSVKDKDEIDAIKNYITKNRLPDTYHYCVHCENSLFGNNGSNVNDVNIADQKANLNTLANAQIFNIRHLQNLDVTTSKVDSGVTSAELRKSLVWDSSEYNEIWSSENADVSLIGAFNGIYNPNLTILKGNNFTIENLVIASTPKNYVTENASADTDVPYGTAGLFRYVDDEKSSEKFRIENLRLKHVSVGGGTGNAGAFIGASEDREIELDTVLADGDSTVEIAGGTNVGGLVGLSAGKLTITNSAASMLVTASGNAGGLVGQQSKGLLTVKQSYVGGHTGYTTDGGYVGRVYFTGTGTGRWNIVGAAAGGLVGLAGKDASVDIKETFSAASVSGSSAGGLFGSFAGTLNGLNTVYTVAPVSGVKEIGIDSDTGKYMPTSGGNGSVFGAAPGSDTIGSGGVYFLPDTYTNPYPVIYMADGDTYEEADYPNGISNIQAIGALNGTYSADELAAILKKVKPASYNSYYGHENNILGVNNISAIDDITEAFDTGIYEGELYTFAIWTVFSFEDLNEDGELDDNDSARYYYGDWAPPPSFLNIRLVVHFVTEVPENTATEAEEHSVKEQYTEEITIQLPYSERSILIPYPEELLGYSFGAAWNTYLGNWVDSDKWAENGIVGTSGVTSESCSSYLGSYAMGTTLITLSPEQFQAINFEENYKDKDGVNDWTEGDPYPYIHLTFVTTYVEDTDQVYRLRFFDYDPSASSVSYGEKPSGSMVLKAEKTAVITNLNQLVTNTLNSEKTAPTRYLSGYRFLGWFNTKQPAVSTAPTTTDKVIYENVYGEDHTFTVTPDNTNAALIEITHERQEIDLYAWYEKIEERTLTVNFLDGSSKPIEGLNSYEITFEADRGFPKEIKLPTWGGLVPSAIAPAEPSNTTLYPSGNISATNLSGSSPSVTFAIPAIDNGAVTESNRDLVYNVTYTMGDGAGYVVLFELLDTKSADSTSNDDFLVFDPSGGTAVKSYANFAEIEEETALYNVTEPGEDPKVNPGASGLVTYLKDLVGDKGTGAPARFEVTEDPILIELQNGEIPASATDYYNKGITFPGEVTVNGTPATVNYLVILQASRVTYELSYDSRGSEDPEPDEVAYGQPIKPFTDAYSTETTKPKYGDAYSFNYWYLDNENAAIGSEVMPDHNETVFAHRSGQPVDFKVLFWLQNANDDEYTLSKYKDVRTAKNGNAFIGGAYAGSFITLSNDDGDNWANLRWSTFITGTGNQPFDEEYDLTGRSELQERVRFDNSWHDFDSSEYFHINWEKTMAENNNGSVEVKASGTTTVNIYYDRNIYTLWFFLGKSEPTEGTSEDYDEVELADIPDGKTVYYKSGGEYFALTKYADDLYGYPATNETENVYGFVNGEWVLLEATKTTDTTFTPKYTYQLTTGESGTQYGIVDGEYVIVTKLTGGNYYPTGGKSYTMTSAVDENTQYYGIVNGSIKPLTLTTTKNYSGNVYTYTESTANTANYGVFDNTDKPSRVYLRNDGKWHVADNNGSAVYAGKRYIRGQTDTSANYTGEVYYQHYGGFTTEYNSESPNPYGKDGNVYKRIDVNAAWKYDNNQDYNNNWQRFTGEDVSASNTQYDGDRYYILGTGTIHDFDRTYNPGPSVYGRSGSSGNYTYFPIEQRNGWVYHVYSYTEAAHSGTWANRYWYNESSGEYEEVNCRWSTSTGAWVNYNNNNDTSDTAYSRTETKTGAYTGERYTRTPNTNPLPSEPAHYVRNGNSAPYTYSLTDSLDGTQYYDDPESPPVGTNKRGWVELVIDEGEVVTYSPAVAEPVVKYTGPYYILTSVENATYYVHHRNLTYGLGNSTTGDNQSSITYTVSTTTNPFTGAYTKTAQYEDRAALGVSANKWLDSGYTGYFYNITARFEADITDQWPDMYWMQAHQLDPLNSNTFVSWVRETGSSDDHIKGKYATMSYELLTNKAQTGRRAKPDNNATGNIPSHILECRYYAGNINTYSFEIYFNTAPGQSHNNREPDDTQLVHATSPANYQKHIVFTGYDPDGSPVVGSSTSNGVTPIRFFYNPHGNAVTLKNGNTDTDLTNIRVARRDNDGQLVIVNGEQQYDSWTNGTTCYYDQKLNFIADVDVPAKDDNGRSFAGWYTDPDGDSTRIDFTKPYLMPDGPVVLYAVWKYDPLDVKFSLTGARFLDTDKTNVLTFPAEHTVAWPGNTAPDKTEFTGEEAVEYGDTIASDVADDRGRLLEAYKPVVLDKNGKVDNNYKFLRWEYVDADKKIQKFYVSAGVTEPMNLYPVFYKTEATTVAVSIYYKVQTSTDTFGDEQLYGTETVKLDAKHLFTIDTSDIEKPSGITDDEWQKYILDPPFLSVRVTSDWVTRNTVDGTCKVVFSFVKDANAWPYTIEYCLNLISADTGKETPVTVLTQTRQAESAYIFESFYTLPGKLNNGFRFSSLELAGGTEEGQTSTDPIAIVKKGEANVIKVYMEADLSALLQGSFTTAYNAKAQGVNENEFMGALPKLGSDLDFSDTSFHASDLEYDPSFMYYDEKGEMGAGVKPTKVGVYRLVISVDLILTVPGENGEEERVYKFWSTPINATTSRPGIVYTIERRDVILESRDVWKTFYDNADNKKLFNGSTPKPDSDLPDDATIGTVAQYQQTSTDTGVEIKFDSTYGEDITEITKKLKNISIGLSGEAFRRVPSTDLTDSTPNAFDFEVYGLSLKELDNYNFYKSYGDIYLWDSKDVYDDYVEAHNTGG